jgi:hypothetical protein
LTISAASARVIKILREKARSISSINWGTSSIGNIKESKDYGNHDS